MEEEIAGVVRCYDANQQGNLVLTIPSYAKKRLNIRQGQRFLVKLDMKHRLIFEPLNLEPEASGEATLQNPAGGHSKQQVGPR
jgi:bifunctional DNA-binding transcriptional regulator/antitoxin component of YhaV-PrlF toxin-antitoxin module